MLTFHLSVLLLGIVSFKHVAAKRPNFVIMFMDDVSMAGDSVYNICTGKECVGVKS